MSLYAQLMKLNKTERDVLLEQCNEYSEETLRSRYEDMLDECNPKCMIAGYEYSTSYALKLVDEVAYNTGFNDFVGTDEDLIEVGDHYYSVSEIEEKL
jgi:hypothetical protein